MVASPLSQAELYLESVGLIDAPGKVLYSSEETLCCGPVYLLGLNPGGSEGASLRDSIAQSRSGQNAYLDEQWAPGGHLQPMGEAILQKRVQGLCNAMGLDTRMVPASNLVFTRSTRLNTHSSFLAAIGHCMPVHEIFMEAVQPDFLMTYGSIGNFAKAVTITHYETRSAEHAAWKAHRGQIQWGGRNIRFGNVPHMSLWASDRRSQVLKWVINGGA